MSCSDNHERHKRGEGDKPLKEIFAEYKPLTERTQMPISPVLLFSLIEETIAGRNRGLASELSGVSELRAGLRGIGGHTSNESWQMVGLKQRQSPAQRLRSSWSSWSSVLRPQPGSQQARISRMEVQDDRAVNMPKSVYFRPARDA